MIAVAALLWRGELRVQGLWGKRRSLMALESVVGLAVLAVLVLRVRSAVLADDVSVSTVAVITTGGALLLATNVLVLGEESRTRVGDLATWSRRLPVSSVELRTLLLASGVLKALLFTMTLVGSVAVGAVLATEQLSRWSLVVLCAIVLPLLPVAVGLRWGARRSGPVSQGLLLVPFGLVLTGLVTPLPPPPAALRPVFAVLALPGQALLGRLPAATTLLLLTCWLLAAVHLLRSTSSAVVVDRCAQRPPRAALLAAAVRGSSARAVLADLHHHRISVRDLGELGLLGSCFATAACLLAVGPGSGQAALVVGASGLLLLPALLGGYGHARAVVRLPDQAQLWLAAQPLGQAASRRAAHRTSLLGGCICLAALVPAAAVALLASGAPVRAVVVWSVLGATTPWVLGGWVGAALALHGARRAVVLGLLLQLSAVRALTAALLTAALIPAAPSDSLSVAPAVLAIAVAVELLAAAGGHALLHRVLRRTT